VGTRRGNIGVERITAQVSRLCAKMGSSVSQGYLVRTMDCTTRLHPRRESFEVIIAATFLVICAQRGKVSQVDRKRVLAAFDERFSMRDLLEWVKVVTRDLDAAKWFQEYPVITNVRTRSGEESRKPTRLAKNVAGLGRMVYLCME